MYVLDQKCLTALKERNKANKEMKNSIERIRYLEQKVERLEAENYQLSSRLGDLQLGASIIKNGESYELLPSRFLELEAAVATMLDCYPGLENTKNEEQAKFYESVFKLSVLYNSLKARKL